MIIAIHKTPGFFSDRWIPYCDEKGIRYKIVDCTQSDIIQQLSDCDALMWHFNHKSPKASKFAKQLIFSIQNSGKKVFPDYNTCWHFDDKIAQKYLLEAIKAPLAPSFVFYSKADAKNWALQVSYPKVFKLRNGAGSDNVYLIRSRSQAFRIINKAFTRGFKQYESWNSLKERYRLYKLGKTTFLDVARGMTRLIKKTEYARVTGKEIGYVYFQDYIPDNEFDIRVIVIRDRAFAIKRLVRRNDFRASGSGLILYEKENFDDATIRLAMEISEKLQVQCMAYDFVYFGDKPLLVEISYGFAHAGYDLCTGYWDRELIWHEGKFNPYGWMIEDLIKSVERTS